MIDRYLAIEKILSNVATEDLVISTTGMISRELFMTDDRLGNFYMIGSMGLLSSFGLGLSLMLPQKRVIILEGDGSAMMSLGTIPLIGFERPTNLTHIILDNEAYESTGGQPSISTGFEFSDLGSNCGYESAAQVNDIEDLESDLLRCQRDPGPHLLTVKSSIAPVSGITRVTHSPIEIRDRFRQHIQSL